MQPALRLLVGAGMAGRWITGWRLAADDRVRLLALVPPRYSRVVADHVTLRAGTDETTPLPSATAGEVVGDADDGAGVQALVVRILGREPGGAGDPPPTPPFQGGEKMDTTDRPDGSTYHLTWSLAEGRRAVESNDVIARLGWREWPRAEPIALEPGRWLWGDA